MSSHSLPLGDWNSINLKDCWGRRDPTMYDATSLTKTDLLKTFRIRLMASAESIRTFSQIQGKREDKCMHFS